MDSGGDIVLGLTPKQRQLLTLLLLNLNVAVHRDRLIEQLWNGRFPASARRNLTTYIARLRRLLSPADAALAPIRTVGAGYLLAVPRDSLDAEVFTQLADQARTAQRNGELREAESAFEQALGLWRGDALFDMGHSEELSAWAERLDEDRRAATEDLFDVRLALGRHHELAGHLGHWTMRHPLRERPHRQLMLALHRAGRSHDASSAYQRLHRVLVDEMGIEPAPDTQTLHRRILTNDPAVALPSPAGRLHHLVAMPGVR